MKSKLFLVLMSSVFFIVSCEKDYVFHNEILQQEEVFKVNIEASEQLDQLSSEEIFAKTNDRSFKTLNQALHCTNLIDALFTGSKTIYAPSDAAFEKLGLNADNVCETLNEETLKSILLYHVVDENVRLSSKGCITMLDGNIAQLNKNEHKFFINDSRLFAKWTQRGYEYKLKVYGIKDVLSPPANNIVATAIEADMFSILVDAVLAADPGIAEALSNEEAVFTVFAPTNEAFVDLLTALGLNDLNEVVEAIGVEGLSTILLYHVVDACAFSNNLSNGLSLTTLQGESLTVDLKNLSLIDKSENPSGLVADGLDILTSNGIVHTIDKVLLPQAILDAL